jgi:hypothetical protein
MHYLYSTATWTAALSAATGTGCIVALLSGANPRSYFLIAAEAAATIGLVSLLVSVFFLYLLTRRQPQIKLSLWGALGNQSAGDGVACIRKRREVLDERLNIDEPRLCSQYMISCTAWSFCAESEIKSFVWEGTSPAARERNRVCNLVSEAKGLPVVHRIGKDRCPFRFASPLARLVRVDGGAQNFSNSGTATR